MGGGRAACPRYRGGCCAATDPDLESVQHLAAATDHGDAWLKVVPPFFAHEGALLPLLDPRAVPPVLGTEPGRVLLGEVPGVDQYQATGETPLEMVRMVVSVQARWIGRTGEPVALGVPDLRPAVLLPRITSAVQRLSAVRRGPDHRRRTPAGQTNHRSHRARAS